MRILTSLCLLILIGCSPGRKISSSSQLPITEIRYLDEYVYPGNQFLDSTLIGGLSGIDFDPLRNEYYLICDDPSSKGPARFYTVKIDISKDRIDTLIFLKVTPLLNSKKEPYANITINRTASADVEAMRYDASRDEFVWTSEGQRFIRPEKTELQDPVIVFMNRDGSFKDSIELPKKLRVSTELTGPRHNTVFEGVSYDEGNNNLFVSIEDALYEDGPRAGNGDSTALIRIFKFNRQSKNLIAEYGYKVDAVPNQPNPPGAFKINGVSDILYLGDEKLLVIERAWSFGRVPSDIRIYIADIGNADNVSNVKSLHLDKSKKIAQKHLLLDMNKLGMFIDNVEGVCFGPTLPNGNRTLIFVVDNNFDNRQLNQFLLFEVIGSSTK
jgi:hypothetical protein